MQRYDFFFLFTICSPKRLHVYLELKITMHCLFKNLQQKITGLSAAGRVSHRDQHRDQSDLYRSVNIERGSRGS